MNRLDLLLSISNWTLCLTQGELKQLLGPVRYDQFVADNETLQIIDNEGSKNHCWMLRSVPQEGLVVVFPGSSHFENFFNAMNINAVRPRF